MFIRFGYSSLNRLWSEVIKKYKEGYHPCGEVICVTISSGSALYFATMKSVNKPELKGSFGCAIPERATNQNGEQ